MVLCNYQRRESLILRKWLNFASYLEWWYTKEVNLNGAHCDADVHLISYRMSSIWDQEYIKDNMIPDSPA